MSKPRYCLTLHKSYYNKGFFNLGVDVDAFVSAKETEDVTLHLDSGSTLRARMTRRANLNGTARVHSGAELRDWFQERFSMGDSVDVVVLGPTDFRIERSESRS